MNKASKILFWILTIGLGFVNPVISVILVILYYLPGIIQEACQTCKEPCSESEECFENTKYQKTTSKMDSFSDDTLEDMR